MKKLLFLATGVLLLSAWLFVTRNIFTPNWSFPLGEAIKNNDCKAVGRLLVALSYADLESVIPLLEEYPIEENCHYAMGGNDFEKYDRLSVEVQARLRHNTQPTRWSQWKGLFVFVLDNYDYGGVRYAGDYSYLSKRCLWALLDGPVDYGVIEFALNNAQLNAQDIHQYAEEKRNYCANQTYQLARKIQRNSPEMPVNPLSVKLLSSAHRMFPSNRYIAMSIREQLRKYYDLVKGYKNKGETIPFYDKELDLLIDRLSPSNEFIDGPNVWVRLGDELKVKCAFAERDSLSALRCADTISKLDVPMGETEAMQKTKAIYTEYYLQRAESLGVLDITQIRSKNVKISESCLNMIEKFNKEVLDNIRDPDTSSAEAGDPQIREGLSQIRACE